MANAQLAGLELRLADGELVGQARELVNQVLYLPYGMEILTEENDRGGEVYYFVALLGAELVGAGKLSLNPPSQMLEESGLWEVVERSRYEGRVAMFRTLAVPAEHQHKGIGRGLYKLRESFAIENGKLIGLSLRRRNTAERLYRDEGYTVLREEPASPELIEKIGRRDYVYKFLVRQEIG